MGGARPSCPASSTRTCTCAAADVPAYLASGILTVRNMWGHPGITRLQREIAAGDVTGPTIYSLSPGLDASPGYWPYTQFVDDASEAERVVAAQQAAGWTTIKVYQRLSAAAFDSIVASVRRRQLRFAGHVPTAVPIQHAPGPGMESIEHYTGYDRAVSRRARAAPAAGPMPIRRGSPALVEATVRSGTWNCPTMAINTILAGRQGPDAQRRVVENRRLFTKALQQGGAPLVAGTDAGIDITAPGTSMLDELREFVASGLSSWEALRLATIEPGRLLGVPQLGTVTVGAPAELLLLKGNPAENLAVLEAPAGVLLHGEWIDGAALAPLTSRPHLPRPLSHLPHERHRRHREHHADGGEFPPGKRREHRHDRDRSNHRHDGTTGNHERRLAHRHLAPPEHQHRDAR